MTIANELDKAMAGYRKGGPMVKQLKAWLDQGDTRCPSSQPQEAAS